MEAKQTAGARSAPSATAVSLRAWFRRVEKPLENLIGGPERLKVVTLLACVLALDAADKATVGAVAAQLESALHIGNIGIGLLVTVSTAVGALATLPFGVLVDRIERRRVLTVCIVVWSLAMIAAGASSSYPMLLLCRLALGAVVAAAAPAVASLTGDFFHPAERGRIYGYILAGELIGLAFGFLISGNLAAVFSWRASFWMLAGMGFILAGVIARSLPEPRRGGQSDARVDPSAPVNDEVGELVAECGIEPRADLVLAEDPAGLSLWRAVRYVLSIRTYRTLIIASALGYFYFTGLRTFALVFMRQRYVLDQAVASTVSVGLGLGAIVGVLLAGSIADGLIARGKLTGRILVGASAYLISAFALLVALLMRNLFVAAPFFFISAAGLGGANPAVDSARLDIMHSRLWGRAEGVRATVLYVFQAAAPPLFGYVSTLFGHAGHAGAPFPARHGSQGLETAFLAMLATLALAGVVMFRALKTYPRDVATAIASEEATRRQ